MKETTKTITFACVGVGMVLLAGLFHFFSQPSKLADFGDVGQPFFEDFTDSEQASSLEVYAMDRDSAQLQQFRVELKDGIWRIPSHYNYPAEAADRLGATAASVMGVVRESLVGRLESDHDRLGVVDPLSDEARDPTTVGKRLTLKDEDGEVLVDYIIGNEAGDVRMPEADRPFAAAGTKKYYYVRRPDEQRTYKVQMDVDLSTKFADWIQPDLLQLSGAAIEKLVIDNYSLREQAADPLGQVKRLIKTQGDQLTLTRKGGFGAWTLIGINDDREEMDNARANQISNTLTDLKIVGVRPKFKYDGKSLLTPDLRLNKIPELERNPREFNRAILRMQSELEDKGFNLAPVAPNSEELMLVSHHGQLMAGTDSGIMYTLHVGKPISGDEKTIEIGGADAAPADEGTNRSGPSDSKLETEAQDEPGAANQAPPENENASDPTTEGETDDDAKNRYVMIRVAFDESLLGEKPGEPVKPTKPVEPEGYQPPLEKPADKPDNETESDTPSESDSADPASTDDEKQNPDEPSDDGTAAVDERKPEFAEYDEKLKEYEQAETQYQLDLTRFENEKKDFEKKIEDGQKRIDELNERFGSWFYVVSADNLKSLQVSRGDLVNEKKPDENDLPPRPDISYPAENETSDSAEESGDAPQPTEESGDDNGTR